MGTTKTTPPPYTLSFFPHAYWHIIQAVWERRSMKTYGWDGPFFSMNPESCLILVQGHLYRESTFLPVRIAKRPIITWTKLEIFPSQWARSRKRGAETLAPENSEIFQS
jgi:hypothetical protein